MINQLENVTDCEEQASATESSLPTEQTATSKLCHYVKEEPVKSVMIGLGLGIGTGVVLGSLFRGSAKYLTHDQALTERIGNHVRNSLVEIVPASLKKHLRS